MRAPLEFLRYFVADAIDEWRHCPGPNVLATVTLAAVLFVSGMNLLVLANVGRLVGRWKEDLRVSVYLADGAPRIDVDELERRIATLPGVSRIDRVDKDEALRRFQASFKDLAEVTAELESNPMPASLEVVLEPGPGAREAAGRVGETVAGDAVVEDLRYDQAFLDRIEALLEVTRWGGAALGIVVFTAVAFVVAGVMRLTVHARRDEIDIMHLVGASPMLVRGPFLVAGTAQGLAGGLLALFLVEASRRTAITWAGAGRGDLFDLVAGHPLPAWPSLMLVSVGAVLGCASAWFAVREAREGNR